MLLSLLLSTAALAQVPFDGTEMLHTLAGNDHIPKINLQW